MQDLYNPPPYHPHDDDPLELIKMTKISKVWKTWYIRWVIGKKKLALSLDMGFSIGQMIRMLQLTEQYHESAIDTIVRDWNIKVKKNEPWQRAEFKRGISIGLDGGSIGPKHPDRLNQRGLSGNAEAFPDTFFQELEEAAGAVEVSEQEYDDTVSEDNSTLLEDSDAIADESEIISMEVSPEAINSIETDQSKWTEIRGDVLATLPAIYECEMGEMLHDTGNLISALSGRLPEPTITVTAETGLLLPDVDNIEPMELGTKDAEGNEYKWASAKM